MADSSKKSPDELSKARLFGSLDSTEAIQPNHLMNMFTFFGIKLDSSAQKATETEQAESKNTLKK